MNIGNKIKELRKEREQALRLLAVMDHPGFGGYAEFFGGKTGQ